MKDKNPADNRMMPGCSALILVAITYVIFWFFLFALDTLFHLGERFLPVFLIGNILFLINRNNQNTELGKENMGTLVNQHL